MLEPIHYGIMLSSNILSGLCTTHKDLTTLSTLLTILVALALPIEYFSQQTPLSDDSIISDEPMDLVQGATAPASLWVATYGFNSTGATEAVEYNPTSGSEDEVNPWAPETQLILPAVGRDDQRINPITREQQAIDAQRLSQKLTIRANTVAGSEASAINRSSSSSTPITPVIGTEVSSSFGNGWPPDGACAVSGAGNVVISNNTHVEMYDEDGTVLYSETDATFWSPLNPTATIFDPRVVYNTFHNRFLVVAFHGTSSTTSLIYIAFSKTSNPTDGWWMYSRTANTGATNMWLDYPHVGYTDESIVISGNLIIDGNQFSDHSRVFMYDMIAGMAGSSMSGGNFDDIEHPSGANTYSINPVSYPYGATLGYCALVSKSYTDKVGLFEINGNIDDGPVLSSFLYDSPDRDFPVSAPQGGVTNTLQVAGRMQGAFFIDNHVYYSHTSADDNLDNVIVVGDLDIIGGDVTDKGFGALGWDYAYPWVLPWGETGGAWDGSFIVPFLRTSSSTFPEFRVVHLDAGLNFGSSVGIKSGQSAITNTTGQNRWGDYIGGGIRENGAQPEVWVHGQYGVSNRHETWTAQVLRDLEGCTDSGACNYDSAATLDDGSCQYTSCAGCTDSEACNYVSGATIDDGTCTYPGCTSWSACNFSNAAGCDDGSCCFNTCVEMTMGPWSIMPLGDFLSFVIIDNSINDTIASGGNLFSTTYDDCLEAGCYTLSVTGDADVDWNLSYDPYFFIIGADLTIFSGTGPFEGTFVIGDGGDVSGCTDASMCNYDADAECDNGSCCESNCLGITMMDTFGDGWNGNVWEVVSQATGQVVESGTLDYGAEGVSIACLEDGCYLFQINVDQGNYSGEVEWMIEGTDTGGYEGNATMSVEFTIGGGGSDVGCTDSEACNYDASAYCDNGTCCYSNCGELTLEDSYGDGWNGADLTLEGPEGDVGTYTFNSGALETMEVCLVDGCYHIHVTSGYYPGEISWTLLFTNNYVIGGGAPFSQDFGLNAVFGCTDPFSCDYNAAATCDDGTCTYPGCMDETACNYQPEATCQDDVACDFSCYGCTYETAINYDLDATREDGSCIFPTPTDCAADINWDGMVSVADVLELLGAFGSDCE